ncbi:MAG: hypothetical protein HY237_00580 [Acidobacteria bacterium]|nr:hypothetical protein [Acidobacteriota bacterium]
MVHRAPSTLSLVVALATCATLAAERMVWKPVERAVLKVDDRPARIWNVYRAEKKDHLLLVQLGRRFLMLDYRAKEIYDLDPAKLERKEKELIWQEADKPAKPLATADWSVRDTGPLRRVRATLSEEGRVLEVQVPTKPDLRTLY